MHKGDTIIPGAGVRWKHLHRGNKEKDEETQDGTDNVNDETKIKQHGEEDGQASGASAGSSGQQMTEAKEDDEDELPWQVIHAIFGQICCDLV